MQQKDGQYGEIKRHTGETVKDLENNVVTRDEDDEDKVLKVLNVTLPEVTNMTVVNYVEKDVTGDIDSYSGLKKKEEVVTVKEL